MQGQTSALNQDDFKVLAGANLASYRQTNIVAVSGGNIYVGDISTQATLAISGSGVLNASTRPQAAYSAGKMYLVDGYNIIQLALSTRIASTFAATAGTAPAKCTLAAMYRDRLVLAAPRDNPQNFFFSRVGTQTDFNYAVANDPATAFAGNASTAGRIGEPIVSLMPFSDDVLLIGGDHNLWAVRGDPADGGSIDLVSNAIGVLGADAWTTAPDGTVYFVGTGGLFRMAAGGTTPELLTDQTYNQYFSSINRGTSYVQMVWDRDRQGAYIFVTPANTGAATHLFYDARNGGLWPISFPDNHGPISALVYDGDAPDDRQVLLGGRLGLVQKMSDTQRRDDGTIISASVMFGPFQPAAPTGDAIVTGMDVTLGEVLVGDSPSVWNCNWKLRGGKSAYEVTEGTPKRIAGGNFPAAGRQLTRVTRLRGGWFSLEFYNANDGDYFSLERVVVHVENTGKQR
jgi:hypothetical protein